MVSAMRSTVLLMLFCGLMAAVSAVTVKEQLGMRDTYGVSFHDEDFDPAAILEHIDADDDANIFLEMFTAEKVQKSHLKARKNSNGGVCEWSDIGENYKTPGWRRKIRKPICYAALKVSPAVSGTPLLKAAEPHAGEGVMFGCMGFELCMQGLKKTLAMNAMTSRKALKGILNMVRKATNSNLKTEESWSDKKVREWMEKKAGMNPKTLHRFGPLINYLFEHAPGKNPFCTGDDAAKERIRQSREFAVSKLLSPYNPKLKVDPKLMNPITKMFNAILDQMLQADCVNVDIDSSDVESGEFTFDHPKFDRPQEPIMAHTQKLIRDAIYGKNKREYMDKNIYFILSQIEELITNWHAHTKYKGDQVTIPSYWQPMADKMVQVAKGDKNVEVFPSKIVENEKNKKASPDCECEDLARDLALGGMNLLDQIGMNLGDITYDEKKDMVTSTDANTEKILRHVNADGANLAGIGRQLQMIEMSELDPLQGLRLLLRHAESRSGDIQDAQNAHEADSEDNTMSEGSWVKVALIGIPIVQNMYKFIYEEELDRVIYTKKLKWFLVLNIAWAMWHQVEQTHDVASHRADAITLHHQNVLFGIYTTALSVITDFDWDGKLFIAKNDKAFGDWTVALYTIWNYSLFETNFSLSKGWDMMVRALGLPILESIANHQSAAYWVNYRRDQLLHTLVDVFDKRD